MHRIIQKSLIFILSLSFSTLLAIEGKLMRFPDIHGDKIVFTYEDDLWLVSSRGGSATRITSHPGSERYAKFSPDGEWIAFTAEYDGGEDVYLIPSKGGEPKRLTYHPAADEVVAWHPDGKEIVFRSNRGTRRGGYLVSVTGGYPKILPLDRLRHASFSPDGTRLALNRQASDRMNWKGYKGGTQQDIWITDLKTNTFKKITNYRGYDVFPMWSGDSVYFASDREDDRMNLYAYALTGVKITRKTFHKAWDVEFPSIGGDKIVYGCGGELWVYDIPTEKSEKLSVEIPSDRWLTRETFIDPSEYIQEITLSTGGDTAVVQARGDVYLITEKEAVNITQTSGSRETVPTLSPDNKWVAFFSDKTGEVELYVTEPKADSPWIQLTQGLKTTPYPLLWSPDSKKLLFGDKGYRIYWIDIDEKKLTQIDRTLYQRDNEIYWEVSEYDWSPDSEWIVYSRCEENMNSAIFLYNLKSKKITRLTDDRYDDTSPSFDKNGKYLYFLSLRNFDPLLDPFMDNNLNANMSTVLLVQLQAGMKPPFDGNTEEAEEIEEVRPINLEGITERIFSVPIPPGTFKKLTGVRNGFFFLSEEVFGFPSWWEFIHPKSVTSYSMYKYDVKVKRETEVIHGIGDYIPSADGSKVAYISRNIAGVIEPLGESIVGEGFLDWHGIRQKVEVFEEYTQIFTEVWRQIRDFFYDPHLHGTDWVSVRKKYEPLIRYVGNRSDLNYLLGQMIGELTASHEYILDRGDYSRRPQDRRVGVGLLGADLKPDTQTGLYRFTHIIRGSNWSRSARNPLEAPHIRIEEGDFLLNIDGQPITTEENYLKYLVNKTGEEITLTVNTHPNTKNARTFTIETFYLSEDQDLRDHEWVEKNYQKVKKATGGRVGYIHLSDMMETGLKQFEPGFRAERFRDGLIIDVRNNGGGFVSWFIIDKLERKLSMLTQTRDFKPMRYPHGIHPGPVVFLCNEGTGSDGEIFAQHVQEIGLGPVIGTDTWGGLIGIINMIPTVDGGLISQANVGFANLREQWVVENQGVHPDIVVENRPEDILTGRDPQLDKAIEVILKMLEESPPKPLKPPPFPKR